MTRYLLPAVALLACLLQLPAMASEPAGRPPGPPGQARKAKFDPTDRYEVRQIEGWRLLVNKDLRGRRPNCATKR